MKRIIALTLTLLLMIMNIGVAAFADEAEPQATIELRGTVVDETNAYIQAAPVTLDDGKGNKYTAQSDDRGRYHFLVKPGVYTLTVEVEGFAGFTEQIDLTQKRKDAFDIKLKVALSEQVEVKDDSAGISTEPDKNLSAITLTEKDLEALPDDPDELLQTLKEMAGAGGGDDAAIYVGGFRERGQIPPKDAILRISINQNPFSAEFSEPGFSRVEIITKPGADTYHGGFNFRFNDSALNAREAFAPSKPSVQIRNFFGYLSGPIIHNRWGFFLDANQSQDDRSEVINATVLNPTTLLPEPFVQSLAVPVRSTNFSIRSDYLLSSKHTIGVQYRYNKNEADNQGIGTFDLPERAFSRTSREDTLRFSLTTILNERSVNEARVQLSRRTFNTQAISDAPAINVLETFNSGGNQGSLFTDNSNGNLDFTNNVTYTLKSHTLKAGFRAEALRFENINRSNFGGTFTFGNETGSPLELYQSVLAGVPGAHPSQFSINRGDPFIGFSQWQFGSFIQDDWKVSPQLTLSLGLRHEFQTHLQDKNNFAPRLGIAWADKKRVNTVRVGTGIFYAGLDNGITSDTIRLDGFHQQQFVITDPDFFLNIPDVLTGIVQPTIRIKADDLKDPYNFISTVSFDRQLPWKIVGSVGYTWQRGVHLLRTRNINAPLPGQGTIENPVLPFPGEGPILEFESSGQSKRHELRFNVRTAFSQKFTLFGFYTLSSTRNDTDSAYTSPADPYDLVTEFGRASSDSRHRVTVGGNVTLPWNFRLGSFINAYSGRPFNILTGRDNNNDDSFTDRPAFASPGDPGAVVTAFGVFNPNPTTLDEIIPRNFGQGPGYFSVDMNVSKTFGFGPPPNNWGRAAVQGQGQQQGDQQNQNKQGRNNRGGNTRGGNNQNRGNAGGAAATGGSQMIMRGNPGGGGFGGPGGFGGFGGDTKHKYSVTVDLRAQNVFNITNLGTFNGVLPQFREGVLQASRFGTATRAINPRRVELSLRFNF